MNDETLTGTPSSNGCEVKCLPLLWELNASSLMKIRTFPEYHGTRLLLILIGIGCIGSNFEWIMTALCSNVSSVLIEAKILKIVSSMFLFENIGWGIIDIISIGLIGLTTESIKGTYSFLFFIICVAFASQLMTLLIYLSMYYLTWNTFFLESKICGLSPIVGAFCIVLAELFPNSVLLKNGQSLTIPCKYLPFFVMTISFVIGMIGISVTEMCLIECGLYSSWLFLRYFQFNHETKMKGNENEQFALGMLFPPIIRIPIVLLSNCCYAVCDSVGCCHSGLSYDSTNNGTNITSGVTDTSGLSNTSANDKIGDNMELLIDQANANDIESSPLDPVQQKKRDEAKKEIEKRLAELRKDMSDRAKSRKTTVTDH